MGHYRVTNPISGEILILKDIRGIFRDPLTGAHLRWVCSRCLLPECGSAIG